MEEMGKREIAYKVGVGDLLEGTYVREEGWEPNYLLIRGRRVSRVNVMGVVISIFEEGGVKSFILDDGSGKIALRMFEEGKEEVRMGEILLVVGRIREFGQNKYLVPEILRKIKDSGWIEVRKRELGREEVRENKVEKGGEREEDKRVIYEKIINLVRKLDEGKGADIGEVIKSSYIGNCEEIIKRMVEEGEIFEVNVGRVKVLE